MAPTFGFESSKVLLVVITRVVFVVVTFVEEFVDVVTVVFVVVIRGDVLLFVDTVDTVELAELLEEVVCPPIYFL